MEPIPETIRAVEELGPFVADGDLLDQLTERANRVCQVVPDCVGLSVTSRELDVTLTLVVSPEEFAVIERLRSLCHQSEAPGGGGQVVEPDGSDPTDEEGWRCLAEATASPGVASSLTMPLVEGSRITGSVNLYGASPRAFQGHHDQLARILGAWAPGAVANADLSFSTRAEAAGAPQRLAEQTTMDLALGIVAAEQGIDLPTARQRLRDAADRAGISEAQLAAAVIELRSF